MARMFRLLQATIPVAGTTFTHGITNPDATALAPTWWHWNAANTPGVDDAVYRTTVATTTQSCGLASSAATTVVDFFCRAPHSILFP